MLSKSNPHQDQADLGGSNSPVPNYSSRFDTRLLRHLYSCLGNPQIRITMGGRLEVAPPAAFPVATIAIRDRRTLLEILFDPQLGFGDAYTAGRVTVEGSLVAMLETVFRSMSAIESRNLYSRIASPLLAFLQRNSLRGARKNIHRHYDLGTEFFRLWLDSQLVYSGAYFSSPSLTLEEAQIAKMDYICRKLNLLPGERVVDIGCGWGALAFHMARHYGAHVQAVSNSHEQILWARHRAAELHLTHQVEFIEDDYRNISTQCDALVSVGMLEHVGAQHYRDMGRVIHRVLDSAGRGLIQTIGLNQPHPFNLWTRKRVFPGTYAPTLRQSMDLFEPGGFSVVDVENLRPHYARTLEHWLERFENSSAKVSEMFGADFVRLWRLYLAGSLAGFSSGSLQHFQILFARKACQRIPLTRAQLYAAEHSVQLEEQRMYAVL
jgi:cyclopropane-fatty-acyl-phospholipid synthase